MTTVQMPTQEHEIVTVAKNIDNGLQAFEERKAELTELQLEANGLKITSIDDKRSILQVSTIRKKLKAARVAIEKEGKSMRDPLTRFSKLISEKEKELVGIIEPTEKALQSQEKWVEDEKEKIRQATIDSRLEQLSFSGKHFDRQYIGNLSEDDFSALVSQTKEQFEAEQAAKAEAERKAQEEQARLKAEREELERLRKEQEERQAAIDAENARIRKEQEEKEAAIRLEREKIEAEKKAAEEDRQRVENEKKRQEELAKAREEAAEKARLKAIEDARIEAEIKARKEQEEKAEAARQLALRPDKDKLLAFSSKLDSVIDFEVSDEKAKAIVSEIKVLIGKIQSHITSKVSQL